MLITFKSKAAADIIMYKADAKRILDLLGKDIDRGIIVHADAKKAIAAIEAAIAESRAQPTPKDEDEDDQDQEPVEAVSFSSRAWPLLEMLHVADEQGKDVVWGV